MPRPRIDFLRKVKEILQHVEAPPAEAATPLAHYLRSSSDIWNLQAYAERNLSERSHHTAVLNRHMNRLNCMVLVNLIESFERFLKEMAAVCMDHPACVVLDDRFNAFRIHGSLLAADFGTDTLGKSLCEPTLWLDCDEINARFRKLLADPFEEGSWYRPGTTCVMSNDFWMKPPSKQTTAWASAWRSC